MEDLELYCTANIPARRSCVLKAVSVSKPSTCFGLSAVAVNCSAIIFTKDMGDGGSHNFFLHKKCGCNIISKMTGNTGAH